MEKSIAVFLMARSGGGKDTQAKLLGEFLDKNGGSYPVLWVSVGDILRAIAKDGTYAGRIIEEKVMQAGAFSPPFIATGAWTGMVMRELREGQHVMFPSSPRTRAEAQDLSDFADFFNMRACPLYIDVSEEEAFRRLKARGRADDTDETIRNRLAEFREKALPAIEYFRERGELITVDGNSQDPQAIHQDILKALRLS